MPALRGDKEEEEGRGGRERQGGEEEGLAKKDRGGEREREETERVGDSEEGRGV